MSTIEYDTFLSHNSSDKPAVEELARQLKDKGLKPWLDKWELRPGGDWQHDLDSALDSSATCCVCIGPSGLGLWQAEELTAAIQESVESRNDFRVIPILLPGIDRPDRRQDHVPKFFRTRTWVKFDKSILEEDVVEEIVWAINGTKPQHSAKFDPQQCPYRGLESFDKDHAEFFFGRKAITAWLLHDVLRLSESEGGNRSLALVGASGSGKSSLARAGLLPALSKVKPHWPLVVFRPGEKPLEELSQAICAEFDGESTIDFAKQLRENRNALHLKIGTAMHNADADCHVVILIDQLEELFTVCVDEVQRNEAVANLVNAATSLRGRAIVVTTLRADYLGKCTDELRDLISAKQEIVGPLEPNELREVIEAPAYLVGCECEPGLVELLIRECEHQDGALPLLQHALERLWTTTVEEKSRKLTVDRYKRIGGIKGALDTHAESVLASIDMEKLGGNPKSICRSVMLQLVRTADSSAAESHDREGVDNIILTATKKRVRQSDLGISSEPIVQHLAKNRLLTISSDDSDTDPIVEIAHEALIRGWDRFGRWISENRRFLDWRRGLESFASKGVLLRNIQLAEAEKWVSERHILDAKLINHIERSRDAFNEEERKWRALATAAFVFALVSCVLAFLNWRAFQNERAAVVEIKSAIDAKEEALLAAQDGFQSALAAVKDVMMESSENVLLNQPGTESIQLRIFERATSHLEVFLADPRWAESPELKQHRAMAHFGIAKYKHLQGVDVDRVVESLNPAKTIQKELYEQNPSNSLNEEYSDTMNFLGAVLAKSRLIAEAIKASERAVDLREELAKSGRPEYQRKLASAKMNLADAYAKNTQRDKAVETHREAQDMRRSLLGKTDLKWENHQLAPTDLWVRRDLAMGGYHAGRLLRQIAEHSDGQWDESIRKRAEASLREAVQFASEAAESERQDFNIQCIEHMAATELHCVNDEPSKAHENLDALRDFVDEYPKARVYKDNWFAASGRVAAYHFKRGGFDDAIKIRRAQLEVGRTFSDASLANEKRLTKATFNLVYALAANTPFEESEVRSALLQNVGELDSSSLDEWNKQYTTLVRYFVKTKEASAIELARVHVGLTKSTDLPSLWGTEASEVTLERMQEQFD